jgi:hypothetical protein
VPAAGAPPLLHAALLPGLSVSASLPGAAACLPQLFNDSGIPIEPFHLRRERESGYFDAAGNYVPYPEDLEDDWLKELQVLLSGW